MVNGHHCGDVDADSNGNSSVFIYSYSIQIVLVELAHFFVFPFNSTTNKFELRSIKFVQNEEKNLQKSFTIPYLGES